MRGKLLWVAAVGLLAMTAVGCGGGDEVELCDDAADNDGDGNVDCDDADCAADAACAIPPEVCDDFDDNDGDGNVDCEDADCVDDPFCEINFEFICDDGIDDDEDGLVDCEDDDCDFDAVCVICGDGEIGFSETCDDGNTTAGDGCDDLCELEDGFACAGEPSVCATLAEVCAEATAAQANNAGDLSLGTDGFNDTLCQFGSPGNELLFVVQQGANQTLTLTMSPDVDSGVDPVLYVRTDCVDGATTVACVDEGFNDDLEVLIVEPAGVERSLTVFADSFNAAGTFTLTVEVQ